MLFMFSMPVKCKWRFNAAEKLPIGDNKYFSTWAKSCFL
uniref:Uncharacterized protein n=1 Tax=Anguilla anguilla TaxID=7936 RepID=A0A0E9UHL9_ANGAN